MARKMLAFSGMQTHGQPRLYRFPPLRKSLESHRDSLDGGMTQEETHAMQQLNLQQIQEERERGFLLGREEGKDIGYEEGVRIGLEEGRRKGFTEGKKQAQAQFLSAAEPLDKLVEKVNVFLGTYQQRHREELLQMVEKVARQVIRCELTLHPGQLLTLVEEALNGLEHAPQQVRVLLNEEEYQRIREAEPDKARNWGLLPDAALGPGECRVVTESSEIDVGCQYRLDQCMETLKENLLPGTPHA